MRFEEVVDAMTTAREMCGCGFTDFFGEEDEERRLRRKMMVMSAAPGFMKGESFLWRSFRERALNDMMDWGRVH